MSLSIIINSVAAAGHAKHKLSSGGVPYSWRAYALQNFILPRYTNDPNVDEVIVAGNWHGGEGYKYVPVPDVHHSWADCIAQRQAGFEAATGDVLIFQHDDHWFDLDTLPADGFADVFSPSRWTFARTTAGEQLNSGFGQYIDGHGALYAREVIERCPWAEVPVVFTMDVEHTKQIRAAGFEIVWDDKFHIYDCEKDATPWK